MMLYYTNHTWAASDYVWEPALSISTTSVEASLCAFLITVPWRSLVLCCASALEHWVVGPSAILVVWVPSSATMEVRVEESQGCMDTPLPCLLLLGMQFCCFRWGGKWWLWPHCSAAQLPVAQSTLCTIFPAAARSQSHNIATSSTATSFPWTLGYSCWDWRAIITGSPSAVFLNSISVCSRPLTPI